MGPILAIRSIYQPGTYEAYVMLSLGLIPTCKGHATMDFLYSAIFKMPASKVKLRFRLLLRI